MDDTDDFIVTLAKKTPEYLPEPYKSAVQNDRSLLVEVPEYILRKAAETCIKDIRITYAAEHRSGCELDDEIDPI